MLGMASCSTIALTVEFEPESPKDGWVVVPIGTPDASGLQDLICKYQQGNVILSVTVNRPTFTRLGATSHATIGPAFLPIIPTWPHNSYPILITVRVESLHDVTRVQFNESEIQFSGENPIQPRAVYLWDDNSKDRYFFDRGSFLEYHRGRLVEPSDLILSKEEKFYQLDFFKIPSNVEEFTLNLGRIDVGNREIQLLPLKYRKMTKYTYIPLFFSE